MQWYANKIHAAIIGMVFQAKNELQQYLTSLNPLYAKYTEGLWVEEVAAAQLGNASVPIMHACGVENPLHAGNIIAQSKATGKWSCPCCSITLVHCPARRRSYAAASCFQAHLDPQLCLGDCCFHLRAWSAWVYVKRCSVGNCKTASSRYTQLQ